MTFAKEKMQEDNNVLIESPHYKEKLDQFQANIKDIQISLFNNEILLQQEKQNMNKCRHLNEFKEIKKLKSKSNIVLKNNKVERQSIRKKYDTRKTGNSQILMDQNLDKLEEEDTEQIALHSNKDYLTINKSTKQPQKQKTQDKQDRKEEIKQKPNRYKPHSESAFESQSQRPTLKDHAQGLSLSPESKNKSHLQNQHKENSENSRNGSIEREEELTLKLNYDQLQQYHTASLSKKNTECLNIQQNQHKHPHQQEQENEQNSEFAIQMPKKTKAKEPSFQHGRRSSDSDQYEYYVSENASQQSVGIGINILNRHDARNKAKMKNKQDLKNKAAASPFSSVVTCPNQKPITPVRLDMKSCEEESKFEEIGEEDNAGLNIRVLDYENVGFQENGQNPYSTSPKHFEQYGYYNHKPNLSEMCRQIEDIKDTDQIDYDDSSSRIIFEDTEIKPPITLTLITSKDTSRASILQNPNNI